MYRIAVFMKYPGHLDRFGQRDAIAKLAAEHLRSCGMNDGPLWIDNELDYRAGVFWATNNRVKAQITRQSVLINHGSLECVVYEPHTWTVRDSSGRDTVCSGSRRMSF